MSIRNQPFAPLAGKVALITGGAQGIGQSYSRRLAELGASIVVADRDSEACQEATVGMRVAGMSAVGIACDVSDAAAVAELADAVRQHFDGRGVDILVNNAGLHHGLRPIPLAEMELVAWSKVLDGCLTSTMIVSRAFVGYMIEQRAGVIVNQSAASAFAPVAGFGAYCVAKAAIVALTRAQACELGEFGIRVNAIAPGFTVTARTEAKADHELQARRAAQNALGRNGKPQDLCGALEFLVTESSAWFTGQTLIVDGGRTSSQ